jgi:hypothetical protein
VHAAAVDLLGVDQHDALVERAAAHDHREPVALGGAQQLRVGEPVEVLRVAGPQDARRDGQGPRARPAAGLVDPDDGPEPVALEGRLQRPGLAGAPDDRPRRLHAGARREGLADTAGRTSPGG